MMTEIEQRIHDKLADPLNHFTTPQIAEAYHKLMEGYRSRVDAEMMAYTFEQSKLELGRREQVVKAAAQGLGHAG